MGVVVIPGAFASDSFSDAFFIDTYVVTLDGLKGSLGGSNRFATATSNGSIAFSGTTSGRDTLSGSTNQE